MLHIPGILDARITCMFPCLCAQGSSIAEYSLVAVKRDTCVLVCLYALRGFTRPSYISRGGGGDKGCKVIVKGGGGAEQFDCLISGVTV